MSKFDILLLALKNFRRRMARSILTIIGVVIGSMAIVVMVSLGIGIQQNMMMMIERWGDLTTITVPMGNLGDDGGGGVMIRTSSGGGVVISEDAGAARGSSRNQNQPNPFYEAQATIEGIEHVVAVMLYRTDVVRLASGRYVNPWASIGLVDTSKLHYFGINVSQGRMLEPGDDDFAIVLAPHMGTEFVNMRSRDPWNWNNRPMDEEGNIIPFVDVFHDDIQLTFDSRFGERPQPGAARRRPQLHDVEVVGFQDEFGIFSWTSFMDIEAYTRHKKAYLNSILRTLPEEEAAHYRWQLEQLSRYDQAYVKVDHRDNVVAVVEQLRDLGFESWSNMEMVDNVNAQMVMIQLVMGAIGAVALFVAAINIANTMIMSIYERTKEIGIMKVIGCRLGDICLLFLLEAVILGVIGGLIGIAASFGASALLNNLPPDMVGNMFGFWVDPEVGGSLSVVPYWLVFVSLGISVGVAVLAGLYPSIRAMRLSALDAIRNE